MSAIANQARQDRARLGILLMLAAWFLLSFTDVSAKWLVLAGLPALQIAFMRYFGAFVASLISGLRCGHFFALHDRATTRLLLLRSAILVIGTIFNFVALKHLPLSVTSTIMNSSPIIVTLLAVPLLGERVGPWRWSAVILGFIGVLIVVRPFGAEFHWASLLIVANAIGIAVFSILTRSLSDRISTQTMQFTLNAIGTVVLLPAAILAWLTPRNALEWALLVGIGLWAWGGHELFARSHYFAEANLLMPFTYSFIIYVTIAGFFVFGTVPDLMTLIGATIIVLSGLVIWWREGVR